MPYYVASSAANIGFTKPEADAIVNAERVDDSAHLLPQIARVIAEEGTS
jgi:hypothetical protein